MPEFYALRFLLCLLEFAVSWSVWRGRHGWALIFCVYAWLDAAGNLMVYQPSNAIWWRTAWLPFALVRLVVAVAVSAELLRLTHGFTLLRERRLMATFGLGNGAVLVISGWSWRGQNTFQNMTTLRQYALLALAAGTTAAWLYVRAFRVVDMPSGLQRAHGWLWCAFLWVAFLASTTGAGGLARLLVDFRSGQYWRGSSDVFLVCQCGLMVVWLWKLRRRRAWR